ncbi:acetoacetate--CoA ligase [Amycolatopsis sp. RM579]|uniref:Acetoacetate--CoA ligase n=1 Tax=Amycolatopsis pithecellobii TaxID=664692 RepID=A0A6N7YM31_9PSEU|nr:acetoacetate--CoA ligase [Amycolatopsis pithecellobii]
MLWQPPADVRANSHIGRYWSWLEQRLGRRFADYQELWRWSVDDPGTFWASVWEYFDVKHSRGYELSISDDPMPDTRWFTGALLNYAENALQGEDDAVALRGSSQTRPDSTLTYAELRDAVARAQRALAGLGVERSDRVAAVVPNIPEAVILFLAAASLGAVFCSCAPEFGPQAILDRLRQIEPAVLVGVDGYRFRGTDIDRGDDLRHLADALPSVRHIVVIGYLGSARRPGHLAWDELLAAQPGGEPSFEQVDADHPLFILFSSGTTGVPKAIVHGHGRIVVEHQKALSLHHEVGPGDVMFAYATTSWVVWNLAVSTLLRGATLVCFDGDPTWPDDHTWWAEIARWKATNVIVGAALISKSMAAGIRPGEKFDLSAVRVISATGSTLTADVFQWVYEHVSTTLQLRSGSGGTDVCTSFIGSCLALPVVAGEIACAQLGVAIDSFDENGTPVRDTPGELVVTKPMPSMPVFLWGDTSDKKLYRETYFATYPGIWRHGDWLTITSRGTFQLTGRSDATLNRGGIRLGTAEFYRVLDPIPDITDSVIVHLEGGHDTTGHLLLIIATSASTADQSALRKSIRTLIKTQLSPRHIPDEIWFVNALPRTLTGKRLEVPIKRMLAGRTPEESVSLGSITNPHAINEVLEIRTRRAEQEQNQLGGTR